MFSRLNISDRSAAALEIATALDEAAVQQLGSESAYRRARPRPDPKPTAKREARRGRTHALDVVRRLDAVPRELLDALDDGEREQTERDQPLLPVDDVHHAAFGGGLQDESAEVVVSLVVRGAPELSNVGPELRPLVSSQA